MTGPRRAALAAGALALVALGLAAEIAWTRPVRDAMRAYTDLIAAANRGDLDAANRLCTADYLRAHPLVLAPEGGVVGLPRGIDKNYSAWRDGPDVLVCPTGRGSAVRPAYRMVRVGDSWRFDGLVGQLGRDGRVAPIEGD